MKAYLLFLFLIYSLMTNAQNDYIKLSVVKSFQTQSLDELHTKSINDVKVRTSYKLNYVVDLLVENKYLFWYYDDETDLVLMRVLSQGTYRITNQQVILTDDMFGYKIVFDRKGKKIFAKTIFSEFREFEFTESKPYQPIPLFQIRQKSITEIRTEKLQQPLSYHTLFYGKYFGLKLIKPNCYEYSDGFVLSKGTFKYNAKTNELELFDPVLNSVWALFFIGEKRLIDSQGGVYFHESVPAKEIYKICK